ncbi:MAG: Mu transposase C-terminal domain-containing protein [Roseitalea sp.]|nr:Mu transposase C-terminal domain-containing protein [Roseitalea sp.]MBO6951010.1 Mu transposase C-terminal domain-containing protein [Rhizobiaceae bacterium]MBO6591003.1 Mu transposase C-terminal domain-containing protein [Roseitalea sp.]MBO6599739.1 Mu transposase C-terminal domain-containing protein [Roseitalea sp.]MBO6611495.1 Mu transposase C-terminal domain-containing protein [Roseitalea sp.]
MSIDEPDMITATREWFTAQEVLAVGSPLLPTSEAQLSRYIRSKGLRNNQSLARRRDGQRGGWEYHLSAWPSDVVNRLLAKEAIRVDALAEQAARSTNPMWHRYEQLTDRQKAECARRLKIINAVHALWRGGVDKPSAVAMVTLKHKISASTYWSWERLTHRVEEKDWLAALAPNHAGRTKTADCHPDAWAFFKADALRLEKPNFSSIYRRLEAVAADEGWQPIPSQKTLVRRFNKEIPVAARTLAREGREAVKKLYPHQTRDRSYMHAMYALNSDGHKFDFFVEGPDGKTHRRVIMVAIQDLFSGMILAHRIGWTEHKHLVRLTIGDVLKNHGIPEKMFLDNGKAFASKDITGGAKSRHRFKIKDEEPDGLLTAMGVEVTFVNPYSGQSKPIERAFRDMCGDIAKHPQFAGAWTGNTIDNKPENYGRRSIPLATVEAIIGEEIDRHNRRAGRRMKQCQGRSFHDTHMASLQSLALPPKRPAPVQQRLWLLAAEHMKANRDNGEIRLLGNRYWTDILADYRGQPVTVRFDPQDLTLPVHVYDRDGRWLCEAPHLEVVRFEDAEQAREHARKRRDYVKAQKRVIDYENTMSIEEVGALYRNSAPTPDDPPAEPQKVHRLATGTGRADVAVWDERAETAFAKSLAKFGSTSAELIPLMPPKDDD